jgi:hypothetical protein
MTTIKKDIIKNIYFGYLKKKPPDYLSRMVPYRFVFRLIVQKDACIIFAFKVLHTTVKALRTLIKEHLKMGEINGVKTVILAVIKY